MNKGTILIADSCAGGFGVLEPMLSWAGDYDLIYLADGEKNPLGKKPAQEIQSIVESWIENFKNKNLRALIIACNTASIAVADLLADLEKQYNIPIISMISGLNKAVSENAKKITGKNVAIFGTTFTVKSEKYLKIVQSALPEKVVLIDGTNTEKLIARGLLGDKVEESKALDEISFSNDARIDTFILACTCFEFAQDLIRGRFKNAAMINPSKYISPVLKDRLNVKKDKKVQSLEFMTTGNIKEWGESMNIIAKMIFGKVITVNQVSLNR